MKYAWKKVKLSLDNFIQGSDDMASFYSVEELQEIPEECDIEDVVIEPEGEFMDVDTTLTKKKKELKLKHVEAESLMDDWELFDLHSDIKEILKKLGFEKPTPIQSATLPFTLNYQDIIGCAQTGSGKSLAFGLPILNHIHSHKKPFAALVIVPTRELAQQLATHLSLISKELGYYVVALTGGISLEKQKRLLSKNPHIVIGTPGRVHECLSMIPQQFQYLVLDEADRMLEAGHFKELETILGRIEKKQTMVFSATLIDSKLIGQNLKKRKASNASLEELISQVNFCSHPYYVNLSTKSIVAERLYEAKVECVAKEKDLILYYLLCRFTAKTIVFVNSIDAIRRLVPIFTLLKLPIIGLHSGMKQKQRLSCLEKFKETQNAILIASDVAARGLDIPSVEQIIHYQIPRSADVYVHRSGRTSRGFKEGASIALVSPEEMTWFKKICFALKKDGMKDFPIDRSIFSCIRDRVALARDIDQQEHRASKKNHENNWLRQAAIEADIDLSDDETPVKSNTGHLRRELDQLLKKPMVPKGISTKYLTGNLQKGLAEMIANSQDLMPTFSKQTAVNVLK